MRIVVSRSVGQSTLSIPTLCLHSFGDKRIEVRYMDVQEGGRTKHLISPLETYIQALWSLQDRNMYCTPEVTQTKKRECEPANEEFTSKVKITETNAEEVQNIARRKMAHMALENVRRGVEAVLCRKTGSDCLRGSHY